jgi:hypothetical protein
LSRDFILLMSIIFHLKICYTDRYYFDAINRLKKRNIEMYDYVQRELVGDQKSV